MEITHHDVEEPRRRVLLVGVGAIPRRCLELALVDRAEVRVCDLAAADEAGLDADVAVVDLTASHDLQRVIDVGVRMAEADTRLVFLGYARDDGVERAISEEMNATFNPSIEGILELLHMPRCRPDPDASTTQARPDSPVGRRALTDAAPGAMGVNTMDEILTHLRRQEGQTLAEYGLILALVAVLCIAALSALRVGIVGTLTSITGSL